MTVYISNGRGVKKRVPKDIVVPSGWHVVKDTQQEKVDPREADRLRKDELVEALEQKGIPFDGRLSTENLERLLKEEE